MEGTVLKCGYHVYMYAYIYNCIYCIYIYNVLANEGLVNSENVSKLSACHLRPVGAALFRSAVFCCEDHLIWKTKNIIYCTYTCQTTK